VLTFAICLLVALGFQDGKQARWCQAAISSSRRAVALPPRYLLPYPPGVLPAASTCPACGEGQGVTEASVGG